MIEAERGKDGGGGAASYSSAAHRYDVAMLDVFEFTSPLRQHSKRDQAAPANMAEFALILVFFAHIENRRRIPIFDASLQFGSGNREDASELIQVRKLQRVIVDRGLIGLQCFLNLVGKRQAKVIHDADVFVA